ncbi:hypothetical protein DMENIID0001_106840 [Sergentomyia squamirostris]
MQNENDQLEKLGAELDMEIATLEVMKDTYETNIKKEDSDEHFEQITEDFNALINAERDDGADEASLIQTLNELTKKITDFYKDDENLMEQIAHYEVEAKKQKAQLDEEEAKVEELEKAAQEAQFNHQKEQYSLDVQHQALTIRNRALLENIAKKEKAIAEVDKHLAMMTKQKQMMEASAKNFAKFN